MVNQSNLPVDKFVSRTMRQILTPLSIKEFTNMIRQYNIEITIRCAIKKFRTDDKVIKLGEARATKYK